jgi:hypothetical protein
LLQIDPERNLARRLQLPLKLLADLPWVDAMPAALPPVSDPESCQPGLAHTTVRLLVRLHLISPELVRMQSVLGRAMLRGPGRQVLKEGRHLDAYARELASSIAIGGIAAS